MHLGKILWTLDTFQAIKEFLSTARLTAALACLVAADKLFRMSDMYLLRLIFTLAAFHTFLAQVKILGIVAGIFFNMTKGHFDGARNNLIKKVAIMSYYNHRTLPTSKICLQPLQSSQVKMVCWLIQQE